jgi:hypoxanthine phosphoribosyltransferase
MAQQIVADLGTSFVMVIVLKGAFVFGADLLRALGRVGAQPRVEFLGLSSYGLERRTSGDVVPWTSVPIVEGQRVLLVEDILDSGLTVTHAQEMLRKAGAATVKLCALLDKPAGRRTPVTGDYVGFTIPPRFVVGYGIDWAERWRELSEIAAVD